MTAHHRRARIAVHKFSSCDGCQLAFLNLGDALLALAETVDIRHFAEAGPVDEEADVDIAFIEGSVSTSEDADRLRDIRRRSRFVVTIGACATAGGIQALRNLHDADDWIAGVYARPEHIDLLADSTAIAETIKVDLELHGCPVSSEQVFGAAKAMLAGHVPQLDHGAVCMECKRRQAVCVMVAQGKPCLGPVTHTGCGAICPRFQRDCYACYGPATQANVSALATHLADTGMPAESIARRLLFINNHAQPFRREGLDWQARVIGRSGTEEDPQ